MLKYRLPSGLFMGAVILSAIFIDGDTGKYIFLAFGIFLAFAGVYEYLKMVEKFGVPSLPILTAAVGSSILAASVLLEHPNIFYSAVLTVVVIAGWIHLMLAENKADALKKNLSSFSALPMMVFPLNFLALIYVMDNGSNEGRIYFLFMLLVTKFGDIGAYTVGTISSKIMPGGNHKIIPKISPKKSWEGTLGGMFISILVSYIFCYYVPGLISDFGKIFPLIAGFILFWGGFIGDLVESSLKRTAGVKDSGNMIPGMGGALDVIDSLVLNAPIFYFFLIIAGGK
jgi:phosphatidate cytidylyltransferase